MASLVAQMVKHLPAMLETQVRYVGREDPLEKEMVTHSGTLAWKIPWTEYYSAVKRNEFESILVSWMNLDSVIQSEVS